MAMQMLYLLRDKRVFSFTKIEGTAKHIAAMERWIIVVLVMLELSFSPPNLMPPTNILNPRMRRILPIIEPISEYFTMSTRPLLIARMAITNSAALPKVALMMPEKWSPVFLDNTSVASPKKCARGTKTADARIKVIIAWKW